MFVMPRVKTPCILSCHVMFYCTCVGTQQPDYWGGNGDVNERDGYEGTK